MAGREEAAARVIREDFLEGSDQNAGSPGRAFEAEFAIARPAHRMPLPCSVCPPSCPPPHIPTSPLGLTSALAARP